MSCVTYTFIIPHNNSKKLLSRCLASIPHRKDIEIIVVDDNSREEEKPKQEREDEQILYIDAANSKGAGRARNEGMKIAKGRWLVFADCDDFFNKGFMDVLDQYKDSNKDVVYYNADYVGGFYSNACTALSKKAMQLGIDILEHDFFVDDCLFINTDDPRPQQLKRYVIAHNIAKQAGRDYDHFYRGVIDFGDFYPRKEK